MKIDLHGIIPPVPTPFEDGRVAPERLAANVRKLCTTGVRGLLALGSNGEYVYLSEAEKRGVVETVVDAAAEDIVVMAGSGCESTAETIRLTRDCAELGAHAALVITPAYYGGKMSPAALIAHFRAVADASPVPVLLYNVPKFTHVNLLPGTVRELATHPNIIGIKDSAGNVAQLGELVSTVGEDFGVMVGTAGALYPALDLGCTGGILALANVAPAECVRVYDLVGAGRLDEARDLYLRLLPVNEAVTATFGIAGQKAAMDMLGYFGGEPRMPLLPLAHNEKDILSRILRKAGVLS
ncbi:MAG: dihydrodipicolinate synthase family protein [Planctomycetota bacterium]|jgi:4-hydroxy-2-oxoglutarate aldolase